MQCETGTNTCTYQTLELAKFNNQIFIEMATITKTFNGKKFTYFCNGEVYKNSTRDYKYACIAKFKHDGHERILSLGNKKDSTYNSMARFYVERADLEVVEIQ